jgi:Spy/CpxP family protein refolding chaperone
MKPRIATRDRARQILSKLESVEKDRELQLLADLQVQNDLGLSPEQVQIVSAHPLQPSTKSHTGADQSMAHERFLSALKLTDQQLTRLKQISVQLQGPPGLRDLVMSGRLKLSAEQMELIQSDVISFISEATYPILNGTAWPPNLSGPGVDIDARETLNPLAMMLSGAKTRSIHGPEDLVNPQIKAALMEVILKRLTPEQRAKWNEITGEKFMPGFPGVASQVDPAN